MAGAALAILLVSLMAAASVEYAADIPLLRGPVFFVTFGIVVVILPLTFLPRARRRRNFMPRWYLGKVFLQVAALPAILLLSLLAALAWLLEWATMPLFLNALIILLLANALLAMWSLSVLELHRLLGKTNPPAPPPASHSPPPPPGRSPG